MIITLASGYAIKYLDLLFYLTENMFNLTANQLKTFNFCELIT